MLVISSAASEAGVSAYTKRGESPLAEFQLFCSFFRHHHGVHHLDSNAPTEKDNRTVWAATAKKINCTLMSGNNTPEEVTITETERQRAQIPNSTSS